MYRTAIVILFISLATGCASITTGQDQIVSVDTPNCPAATCRLTNKDGTFFVSSTPGSVSVNRACGKMTVQCSKEGAEDVVISVSSSVKAMAFGNILFGGLIGAGVDAATGAACEYPSLVPVPMVCDGGQAASKAAVAIPAEVVAAAEKLQCTDVTYVARAGDGKDVYMTECEGMGTILSCNEKGCSASAIESVESDD